METKNNTEEIQYCTECGAVNRKSAVECTECGQKVCSHHRPIEDFLKKRAKDVGLGVVKEQLFKRIREYLLSHLYGAVLTLSIVATGAAVIATATPYIEKVTEAPFVRMAEEPEAKSSLELVEDDWVSIRHIISAYDAEIDNSRRSASTYWEDPEEYADASELFAENNIAGYTYSGRHDLYNNPIDISLDEISEYWEEDLQPYGQRDWVEQSLVTNENVTTDFAKKLYTDGYNVAEIDYYLMTFNGVFDYDFDVLPPLEKDPYELLRYKFVIVRDETDENWYIAQETLEERRGV